MKKSKDILVSILCLAYNHEKYIEFALEGFLKQKVDFNYEILIHEDASTDNTAKIIKEYQEKYPDLIKIIYQKENQYQKGVKVIKNLLDLAQGKYLATCEGDDFWTDENKLQKQIDFLEKNLEYTGTYHNVLVIDENGDPWNEEQNVCVLYKTHVVTLEKNIWLIGQTSSLVCKNFWINSSEEFKKIFLEREANGDNVFSLVLTLYGKIFYFEEIMSSYRRIYTGDSWTSRTKDKNLYLFYYNSLVELESIAKRLKNKDISFKEKKRIVFSSIIYFIKNPNNTNFKIMLELLKKKESILSILMIALKKILVKCKILKNNDDPRFSLRINYE